MMKQFFAGRRNTNREREAEYRTLRGTGSPKRNGGLSADIPVGVFMPQNAYSRRETLHTPGKPAENEILGGSSGTAKPAKTAAPKYSVTVPDGSGGQTTISGSGSDFFHSALQWITGNANQHGQDGAQHYQTTLPSATAHYGVQTPEAPQLSEEQDAPHQAEQSGQSPFGELFDGYYQSVYGLLSTAPVTVNAPSYEELYELYSAMLRPDTDAAIDARNQAAAANMAELDADAYSRGMGSSTFVTSMHGRELSMASGDIAQLEAQYASTLAAQLMNAMNEYNQMSLQAQMFNAQLDADAKSDAYSAAFNAYGTGGGRFSGTGGVVFSPSGSLSGSSHGSSGSSHGSGSSGSSGSGSMSLASCTSYLNMLSPTDRANFFHSNDPYWAARRNEMISSLGAQEYAYLCSLYSGTGGSSGGGNVTWMVN